MYVCMWTNVHIYTHRYIYLNQCHLAFWFSTFLLLVFWHLFFPYIFSRKIWQTFKNFYSIFSLLLSFFLSFYFSSVATFKHLSSSTNNKSKIRSSKIIFIYEPLKSLCSWISGNSIFVKCSISLLMLFG